MWVKSEDDKRKWRKSKNGAGSVIGNVPMMVQKRYPRGKDKKRKGAGGVYGFLNGVSLFD